VQVLIVAAILAAAVLQSPRLGFGRASDPVLVRGVADGRTITVAGYGRIRLLAIDTPPAVAWRARDRLADLVLAHWVRLEFDGFGASAKQAYVIREDNLFVNSVLVSEGLARVAANAPDARRDELVRAEQRARMFRLGVWASGDTGGATGYTSRGKRPSARNP
jgi:endonuclease YncB( thermonuclease family)